MSDYLGNLAMRTLRPAATLQPRSYTPFEPATAAPDISGVAMADGRGAAPREADGSRHVERDHAMTPESAIAHIPNDTPWRLDQIGGPGPAVHVTASMHTEGHAAAQAESNVETFRIVERKDVPARASNSDGERSDGERSNGERSDGERSDPLGPVPLSRPDASGVAVRPPWEIPARAGHPMVAEGPLNEHGNVAPFAGSEAFPARPAAATRRIEAPHENEALRAVGGALSVRAELSGRRDEFVPSALGRAADADRAEPALEAGGSVGYLAPAPGERRHITARIEPSVPHGLHAGPGQITGVHIHAASEAPAEQTIRVTIGRIEVRAVMPPPARPEPAARRAGPTISLDDYLRRPKRGNR